MSPQEKVKLARWFNARGIRMMKCAGHVESCGHYKAFKELADRKFGERDEIMWRLRVELGRQKQWRFMIVLEGHADYWVEGFDELSSGANYESECEWLGVPCGDYTVRRVRGDRA